MTGLLSRPKAPGRFGRGLDFYGEGIRLANPMAKLTFPLPAIVRSEVLYGGNAPKETLSTLGFQYQEEGLLADAIEFFARAENDDALDGVLRDIESEGNAFLYQFFLRETQREAKESTWKTIAMKAKLSGMEAYQAVAEQALETLKK